MSSVIEVGGIKVSALNDGEVHLPPMFYPGLDFGAHPELLQADGTCHIPVAGHYVVRVCSHGEAAYLLGDVVHHPLQLNDQGISFLSEAEPERALRAREELLTALQGRSVSIGMTHFPGLDFQQISMADGRAWSTAG